MVEIQNGAENVYQNVFAPKRRELSSAVSRLHIQHKRASHHNLGTVQSTCPCRSIGQICSDRGGRRYQ